MKIFINNWITCRLKVYWWLVAFKNHKAKSKKQKKRALSSIQPNVDNWCGLYR